MRDYISYARNNIQPEIGDAAVDRLVHGYLDMRRMGGSGKTITATPRQLESLIRISQALAKMRLSHVVEEHDVMEAIRLMKVATQTAATDPRTGTIDMDMITTGRSVSNFMQSRLWCVVGDILHRLDRRWIETLSHNSLRSCVL